MARPLKEFRQNMPQPSIIINDQYATTERGLSHHESLTRDPSAVV